MLLFPLLFGTLLGSSCIETGLNPEKPDEDLDLAPELSISPERLDFGELRPGESGALTVTLSNEGTKALSVSSVRIEGDTVFTMTAMGATTIEPGATVDVAITFSPVNVEHEGTLVVLSDDPKVPRATVDLVGYGLVPQLYVFPNPIDFGRVEPECARDNTITLKNIGREELTVDGLAQLGDGFVLDEADLTLPLKLEPEETYDLKVTFTPVEVASYSGELWVSSNGGDPVVPQTGEGAPVGEFVDEWTQPRSNQVDIMFFIDKSCSMEDDKERLASNFTKFTDKLSAIDADYLVMVATKDNGCKNGAFITKDTAKEEISAQFRQAVDQPGGAYTEAGLMITRNAVNATEGGECNEGFMRDGSMVSFVLISDEPEQSPSGASWSENVAAIRYKAPTAYINSVVGPVPDGCATAEPGYGYSEASTATGGLFLSICDYDWGEHVSKIADLATQVLLPNTFYLEDEPQDGTIRVTVDGEEVLTGWRYDETANAIVFEEESIPGEGTLVQAFYASGYACD